MDEHEIAELIELGARVKAEITASGLDQKDVAAAARMDPTSLSKSLTGKRRFRIAELQIIAAVLLVPFEDLAGSAELARGAPPELPGPVTAFEIDENVTPMAQLTGALQTLHAAAREPTTREISEAVGCSHTTVAEVLRGARVTSWPVLERIVRALNGDPEQVRPLWLRARVEARRAGDVAGSSKPRQQSGVALTPELVERMVRAGAKELMVPFRGNGSVHWDSDAGAADAQTARWLAQVVVKAAVQELLFGRPPL